MKKNILSLTLVSAALTLVGCGSSDNGNKAPNPTLNDFAMVQTVSPTNGASAVKAVSLADFSVTTPITHNGSDYVVNSFNENYYHIGRFNVDRIQKYSLDDQSNSIWSYSANASGSETDVATANPHQLVFVNEQKAYLIRNNSPKVWIVNPSAATEADFRIGTIDLSAYISSADTDGRPEAFSGLIHDGKLFIVMQRLVSFEPSQSSYLAVFDVATNAEIDTNPDDAVTALKGIELESRNPFGSQISEMGGKIYISSIGSFAVDTLIGGIETVDSATYQNQLLVDDDVINAKISGMSLVDSQTGYLLAYHAYKDVSLVKFNPTTGAIINNPVVGYSNLDIRTIEASPNLNLWVAIADPANAGIDRINPSDNSKIGDRINTAGLFPSYINFTDR